MSNYQRSTRECSVSQLQPELLTAIREYFQNHDLGDVETECQLCCETVTESRAGIGTTPNMQTNWLAGWLEPRADAKEYLAVLLTSQALIWARSGAEVRANGANLQNIQVKPAVSLFSKNTGLVVEGLIYDSKALIRGTIGMGPELAAQKFYEEVQKAVEKANPTVKRKLPGWLGGR